MTRNLFITWHYTSHGIAFMKHILSWFYKNNTVFPPAKTVCGLSQEELNDVFDTVANVKKFDKILYLTAPQTSFDKVSSRFYNYKHNFKDDEVFVEKGLVDIYEELHTKRPDIGYVLSEELKWMETNHPEMLDTFKKYLWRDIQHYDIKTQIDWLKNDTNFKNVYAGDFQEVELDIDNLRDVESVFNQMRQFVETYIKKDDNCVIDISLSGSETQVAWFILADNNILPPNTSFIQTYDNKQIEGKRFKPFDIMRVPTKLIEKIRFSESFYEHTKSHKRQLVNKMFNTYLQSGFPVLLLGERGIGKSHLVRHFVDKDNHYKKKKPIEANCASFTNNSIAESELFGYVKGAFTDAKKEKKGLIEEAENGVLFLDEIHHLSEMMQTKLMKAFQTDTDNNFTIRQVGGIKEIKVRNVKLVFATNKTINELQDILLPDFYDRIVQYVVEIPPLRETREDLEKDFVSCFDYLYPNEKGNAPKDKTLMKWIKTLELKGNYRDLQNIIRYYCIFDKFDTHSRKEICSEMKIPVSAFEYAKKCYEMYHSNPPSMDKIEVKIDDNDAQNIEKEFHQRLTDWAIKKFGSRKEAAIQLNVSEKTLNNWSRGL